MTTPENLEGKRIVVVGMGRSGVGAARFCAGRGAAVTVTDRRTAEQLVGQLEQLDGCASLELGGHQEQSFVDADLIVLSPGVPEIPPIVAARRAGVPIIGELELSSRFVEAPILAITGTNGKSTTTALAAEMLAADKRPTFAGGNLGKPLVEAVGSEAAGSDGALVVEVSSFQLETVQTFRAKVALLLNLSEDHLDRYPDYAAYVAAKARIFERQTQEDFAVVNGKPDQRACVELAFAGRAQILRFRLERGDGGPGAWVEGDRLVLRLPDGTEEDYPADTLKLAGRHNVENALAALLGARLMGASPLACLAGMVGFAGLDHRMQYAGERGGVRFYNDSKATNVGSVVGSLTGYDRGVVLVAGGKDKGGDYAPLLDLVGAPLRQVVLIGAAADKIAETLDGHLPLHRATTLPEAVTLAGSLARPGEAVVLSPACSSYDMFDHFEQRGQVFIDAVDALPRDGE